MPNFNDAKITSLYVNGKGSVSDIQDDAPNAPAGGVLHNTNGQIVSVKESEPFILL